MESELSKLKEKWAREFDDLPKFSEENIKTWTVSYVNLNNNILNNVIEAREELIDIERELFEMKIKQEITDPPL